MNDWQVTIDSITAKPVPDEQLGDLVDILTNCSPAVSGGDGRLSVILTIDAATDPADAIAQARAAWHAALLAIGLTGRDIVDVDVRAATYDVIDAELAEPTIPELWGAHEAAQHLGVSRQRIHQLSIGNRAFPEPVVRIALGPLWTRASIEAFDAAWSRRPGRPSLTIAGGSSMRIAATVAGPRRYAAKAAALPARRVAAVKASPGKVAAKTPARAAALKSTRAGARKS